MTRLELHDLRSDKRAGELVQLVEAMASKGRRLVIWVADDGRRKILDDYLWTFDKTSFVPHAVWQPAMGELDEPVVLVGVTANPNRAEVLVVGDDLPPEAWAREFDEIHDFIQPGADGEDRRSWWQGWRGQEED